MMLAKFGAGVVLLFLVTNVQAALVKYTFQVNILSVNHQAAAFPNELESVATGDLLAGSIDYSLEGAVGVPGTNANDSTLHRRVFGSTLESQDTGWTFDSSAMFGDIRVWAEGSNEYPNNDGVSFQTQPQAPGEFLLEISSLELPADTFQDFSLPTQPIPGPLRFRMGSGLPGSSDWLMGELVGGMVPVAPVPLPGGLLLMLSGLLLGARLSGGSATRRQRTN